MDTFLYIIVALAGIVTFGYGIILIIEIEEITIGKTTSQLLAVIISILAFYRIDTLPFIEEVFPDIVIDNEIVEWLFIFVFVIAVFLCLRNIFENWEKELARLRKDTTVFFIFCLFGISSVCFGYIA